MSKTYRLGIDIDGVLADFTKDYIRVLEAVSGKTCTLQAGEEPPCWHFETAVGFDKEDVTKAWGEIKEDPVFWVNLSPTMEAIPALQSLKGAYAAGHDVYFITNRMGIAPHMQTMVWLMSKGFPAPTVLLSPEINRVSMKGALAKGLQLTHFIDDKPGNVEAVKDQLPECTVALLSKRYNEPEQFELKLKGIIVVKTVLEFFQLIVNEEKADAIKAL